MHPVMLNEAKKPRGRGQSYEAEANFLEVEAKAEAKNNYEKITK